MDKILKKAEKFSDEFLRLFYFKMRFPWEATDHFLELDLDSSVLEE